MTDLLNWLATQTGTLGMLLLVILAKWLIELLIPLEPLRYFRWYCSLIGNKVNRSSYNAKQLALSGALATLVAIMPIIVFIALFEVLIDVVWLWHAFLLWLSLGWFAIRRHAAAIAQAIKINARQRAKEKLGQCCLRQTQSLTDVGLSKATIESLILRFNHEMLTVAMVFLAAGPIAALSYRLLYEAHLAWNPKRQQFKHFGRPLQKLVQLIQWPGSRLISLVLIFITPRQPLTLLLNLASKHFFQLSNYLLVLTQAWVLGVSLNGAVMYDDSKTRPLIANEKGRQPAVEDILHCRRLMDNMLLFLFALAFCMLALNIMWQLSLHAPR